MGLRLTRADDGLAATNPDIHSAGDDAANSVFIDDAQIAVTEWEIHGLGSGRIEVDATKSCKRTDRSAVNARMLFCAAGNKMHLLAI